MWLSSRHRCTSQNSTTTFEKKKKIREKVYGKKIFCSFEIFSFWEDVDDFWSVSNSRRHRCNRKAICPYRICYVISQNWASFFDDAKCVKIASASFLVIGNGTPSFHFLDPATADGKKKKTFPYALFFYSFLEPLKVEKVMLLQFPKDKWKLCQKKSSRKSV